MDGSPTWRGLAKVADTGCRDRQCLCVADVMKRPDGATACGEPTRALQDGARKTSPRRPHNRSWTREERSQRPEWDRLKKIATWAQQAPNSCTAQAASRQHGQAERPPRELDRPSVQLAQSCPPDAPNQAHRLGQPHRPSAKARAAAAIWRLNPQAR